MITNYILLRWIQQTEFRLNEYPEEIQAEYKRCKSLQCRFQKCEMEFSET